MSKTDICFSLPSGIVVRAKFDVNVVSCILDGSIKIPDNESYTRWHFEDMELPQTFFQLSFFTEQSVPIVFKLELGDLMKLKDMERLLPKKIINGLYIKEIAIKYHKSCQRPECYHTTQF